MQTGEKVWRDFETSSELEQYLTEVSTNGNWGKGEYQSLVKEEVRDEETGEILEEAEYETISAEFTYEIEDVTNEVDQQQINQEAEAYLLSTDWLIVRFMETGVEVPFEISEERQNARNRIVK